jgi:lon-related putative ATP-dependent protease
VTVRGLRERRPDLVVVEGELRLTVDVPASAFEAVSEEVVGQERAVEAMELGLGVRQPGYHVFVAGSSGTGRSSAVASILGRLAPTLPVPADRAYVHRFHDPDRPRLLTMPPGTGRRLAAAMEVFIRSLVVKIPQLLENPELDRRRDALGQRYGRMEEEASEQLRAALGADGFGLVSIEAGPVVMPEVLPIRNGRPVMMEQLEKELPPHEFEKVKRARAGHADEVRNHFRAARDRQREFAKELLALVRDAAEELVAEELHEAAGIVPDGDVGLFLRDVRRDAVAAIGELAESGMGEIDQIRRRLERYRVNVIADRAGLDGAPVVDEAFPTRQNLAGSVERIQEGPFAWRADAGTLRGGSLIRADGGFLVVQALDLLSEPGAWDQLKKTLKNRRLEMGGTPGMLGLPRVIEPDPVPVDLKVVLIGERWVYDLLCLVDPDFRRLFGMRADFEPDMPNTDAAIGRYATVLGSVVDRDGLPPLAPGALGALVEEGITLAGRRSRVSLRFGEITKRLREAAFYTTQRGGDRVERADVAEATRRRARREGAISDRIEEYLETGRLLVATSGHAVGQVNGLSVYDLGYHAFGKPTRITASAAPGRAGIINIEREARLSGGVYDKGVLIISGFLRRRYVDMGLLSLTASLAFEQSYAGVDGDSASIAEVVALISELSGLPVDQAIAITGSINQHGAVQPVGGVNEKIEGFHALCAARGLDGSHGVLLPRQNVEDLMLDPAIVADVAEGRFTVMGVGSVDEALEVALDAPIAEIDAKVRECLEQYSEALAAAPGGDLAPTGTPAQPPTTPLGAAGHILSRPVDERAAADVANPSGPE